MRMKWVLFIVGGLVFAQDSTLTFDKIYRDRVFSNARMERFTWFPGEDAYLITEQDTSNGGRTFLKVNMVENDTLEFISSDMTSGENALQMMMNFTFSNDGRYLLSQVSMRRIWRHSRAGKFILIDTETNTYHDIGSGDDLRNVKFSPTGTHIAYVKDDNNIYVWSIQKQKEKQITKDGSNTILNGHPGWVYEEEFRLYDGYRWSPDGKYIAYWREDQSMVKQFHMTREVSDTYSEVESIYYPKAGEANPYMKIGVVSIGWGRIRWIDLGEETDRYIPAMEWITLLDGKQQLVITVLNRKQNHVEWMMVDPKTNDSAVIYSESDTCFVEMRQDEVITDTGLIYFVSERSGYNHLYRLNPPNSEFVQLTGGNWDIRDLLGVYNDKAYFYGYKDGLTNRHLYSVSLKSGELRKISDLDGTHTATITPSGGYYVHRYSSWETPPVVSLRNIEGELVRIIEETDRQQYDQFGTLQTDLIEFVTPDGLALSGALIKPPNFDPTKSYPVIVNDYGMVGAKRVANRWIGNINRLLATSGYLVFSMDTRHSLGYGKENINRGYGDIGKWLIQDNLYALDYLGSLGYVDTTRVGAWGWSGGGYFAALALTKTPEAFDVGVAVAPVTDWKYYDSIYTERYMGHPEDNPDGYTSASVFTYADQLKGKLLLLHGAADDNVHAQNTTALANEFVRLGKDVDVFIYPERNHGIYGRGATYHVFKQIYDYFTENL